MTIIYSRNWVTRVHHVDLAVVGFGAAGAAAAIDAHDRGLSVAILEKQHDGGHTPSTRMSGGAVMAASDARDATTYLTACAGGLIPADVCGAWAQKATTVIDWLDAVAPGHGLAVLGGAEHPELPGSSAITSYCPGGGINGGAGRRLFASLATGVEKRSIATLWHTPGRRLIRDAEGGDRVSGVQGTSGREVVEVRARRGVLLSCGGFEYDEEMKRDFLRASPVHFYGNPGNRGDGVRMAQAVGAALWHMNQMVGRAVGRFPGVDVGFIMALDPPGYVIVDRHGERFADESAQAALGHSFYYHLLPYDPDRREHPRIPCYWIFDERRRRAGPLTLAQIGAPAVGLHTWSADNTVEIERGWIARGRTAEEAAHLAGVANPERAARTVAEYNRACTIGSDGFGRPASTLVPLDAPPFSCVALWPGGPNTSGGPRKDARSRVLDPFGDVIDGLYAAGELGQAIGMLYPANGADISEALCFGRIVAEDCALGNPYGARAGIHTARCPDAPSSSNSEP